MNKAKYVALRNRVRKTLEEMQDEPFVSVEPWHFVSTDCRDKEITAVWHSIVKDLGLVPDGYGSWAPPDRGLTAEQLTQIKNQINTVFSYRK